MAILTVLTTIPQHSTVTIFCDSQTAIQNINKYNNSNTQQGKNLKNTNILYNIYHMFTKEQIDLTLHKIKAHSRIIGNEEADKIAKRALELRDKYIILPNTTLDAKLKCRPQWNNYILETPIKLAIKQYLLSKHVTQWRLLNRNRISISKSTEQQINWSQSIRNIHPTKVSNFMTDKADHRQRGFASKLWNLELPTKSKLHNQSLHIYSNEQCDKCLVATETTTHPFTCRNQQELTKNKIV